MPQLNTVKPMREDPPFSDDSLSRAKRQQAEDRAKVTAETGLKFDADGNPYLPAKVLTFAQKDADALFAAPSAVELVVTMQMIESIKADEIAHVIAEQVHGADSLYHLTARQQASCRFAAAYAIRAQHDGWTNQAHRDAEDAADRFIKDEAGRAFSHLTDEHRRAVAVPLASAVICAFLGLLEGSRHLSPGQYLRVTEAGK
jgi:hypothetical protein